MSSSYEKLVTEIKEYIDNYYIEFGDPENEEGAAEYDAEMLIQELLDKFKPKLLENDFKRTGNVLFLWEAIAYHSYKNSPLGGDKSIEKIIRSYLIESGEKLITTKFDDDANRYLYICEELKLKDRTSTFAEYLREKHQRIFLATYYEQIILDIERHGIPDTDSDKNKMRKSCRIKAAKMYKYRKDNEERTYFDWVKNSEFSAIEFLCFYEIDSPGLEKRKWVRGNESESIDQIDDLMVIEILKTPEKYNPIFEEF